jgi:hypothetical protein
MKTAPDHVSTTPARFHRLSTRSALAAALATAIAALAPAAALASARHDAHGSIARKGCTLKRGKKSSNRHHAAAQCARRHLSTGAGRLASSARVQPPIEVTSLTPERSLAAQSSPSAPAPSSTTSTSTSTSPEGGVVSDPIDPKYLTELPFGKTSFWVQPWRSYLDTWPSSHLTESVGINFNVPPTQADSVARLLHDSGFKLARMVVSWNAVSYSDPTKLRPDAEPNLRARLTAMREHGLRPLLLLEANSGDPTPSKRVTLETVTAAPAGALTVTLTPASAAQVVPGKTGLDNLTFGGGPDELITSVNAAGVATLAMPLPAELPAGAHSGTTLLYAPFGPPMLANGLPNPGFAATLAGWLNYVAVVTKYAASILGPGGFDVEIWNELTFGSQFLNSEHYYSSAQLVEEGISPEGGPGEVPKPIEVTRSIINAMLNATVAYLRSPLSGLLPAVGISNGFASQTPFPGGALAPLGLTALSKHPYAGLRSFPSSYDPSALRPVNALGVQDTLPKAVPPFNPLFVPQYESLLPEYFLTATSTETLIRDIAPFTTEIYGFPHGREVGPLLGTPVQKWITEYNLSIPKQMTAGLSTADKVHFHAKALLRSLVATVSKGFNREYLFTAGPGGMSLIGEEFYKALESNPGSYPGDQLGGEIMSSFRNLTSRLQGPGPSGAPQQLKLLSIGQEGNHAQFVGDGTAAHPTLYDREVLAAFPYQDSPTRFVIPFYVMTRDLLTLYSPTAPASDPTRFDLPDETFRITLGNLPETRTAPTVSAYDPIKNQSTPARLLTRENSTATFEIATTDYPRLLSIEYTGK